jgi:hypothetical protein
MTSGQALHSAREQINFESTQELKAFVSIDISNINRDRSDQLKSALEDNVKEKEKELD